jgi:hypothetical protein
MKKLIEKHFKNACQNKLIIFNGLIKPELEKIIWEELWQNLWYDFGMKFELNLDIKLREDLKKERHNG